MISLHAFADEVCQIKGIDKTAFDLSRLDAMGDVRGMLKKAPWAIGAGLLGGGLTYFGSRTDPKTGKTPMELAGEKMVELSQRTPHEEKGYGGKMRAAFAHTFLNVARVAKEHPVRAALSAAMVTAPLGAKASEGVLGIKALPGKLSQFKEAIKQGLQQGKAP